MKKTQLERKTPLKSHSSLKNKSPMKKRRSKQARAREFSKSVRQYIWERCGGICEVCHQRQASELHHCIYRSQGGSGELSNGLYLCKTCHDAAHSTRSIRDYCVQLAQELAEESDQAESS